MPAQKRRAVQAARDQFGISEWQACRYLRVNRRMVRNIRIVKDDPKISLQSAADLVFDDLPCCFAAMD